MTEKEACKLGIMKQIEKGTLTLVKASKELDLSLRQTKRIWKRYRKNGSSGLISLQRNKPSHNHLSEKIKKEAIEILKMAIYEGFGPTIAKEKLQELHGVDISVETVRKWMLEADLWHSRKRKEQKIHQRRIRRAQFGELIQADGSHHNWFEGRGPKCCLILFVDDATSQITAGGFFPSETIEAYSTCLKAHLNEYGRPLAMYVDKHSVFRVNKEEVKTGSRTTFFGSVLQRLDIELICANSPQAKGRVERKNRFAQDRLIKDMRLANICTIEEANKFLPGWVYKIDRRFTRKPICAEDAHRLLRHSDLDEKLFLRHDTRKISKELSFQHNGVTYQIKADSPNRFRHSQVDVFWKPGQPIIIESHGQTLEYSIWQEQAYNYQPKILDATELENLYPTRNRYIPPLNHPWRPKRKAG